MNEQIQRNLGYSSLENANQLNKCDNFSNDEKITILQDAYFSYRAVIDWG